MSDPRTAPRLALVAVRAPALVQDGGRPGYMHHGVPPGGAMVPEWLAAANRAVGNAPDAAAIELFGALEVRAEGAAVLLALDDAPPRELAPGASLELAPRAGARVAYLALRGGLDVPRALGGRGTLPVARLGGLAGRALRRGDELAIAPTDPRARPPASPAPRALTLDDARERVLRAVPGPDLDRFAPDALAALTRAAFVVSAASDRVGTRLEGGAPIARRDGDRAESAPMVRGAIQVPAGGAPIVLGPDHPTTGGYPVIATVIRADWGALGARLPGAPVRFALVSPAEARALSAAP